MTHSIVLDAAIIATAITAVVVLAIHGWAAIKERRNERKGASGKGPQP